MCVISSHKFNNTVNYRHLCTRLCWGASGQSCVMHTAKMTTVPPKNVAAIATAQMRSSTAAARIQSLFIPFSLSSSRCCSSSQRIRVSRRSQILFNSWCVDSSSDVPTWSSWMWTFARRFVSVSSSDGDDDFVTFMDRRAANLLHRRFFICYVKTTRQLFSSANQMQRTTIRSVGTSWILWLKQSSQRCRV